MVPTYQRVKKSLTLPIGDMLENMARGSKCNYTNNFAMVRLSLGVKLESSVALALWLQVPGSRFLRN
jgi:hypothetical protein